MVVQVSGQSIHAIWAVQLEPFKSRVARWTAGAYGTHINTPCCVGRTLPLTADMMCPPQIRCQRDELPEVDPRISIEIIECWPVQTSISIAKRIRTLDQWINLSASLFNCQAVDSIIRNNQRIPYISQRSARLAVTLCTVIAISSVEVAVVCSTEVVCFFEQINNLKHVTTVVTVPQIK